MPKSGAERNRSYIRRRRQSARQAGLCITCCKFHPGEGRKVCSMCSQRATRRTSQRRTLRREVAASKKIVDAHIRAGDEAYKYHLYTEVAQHYQDALKLPNVLSADRPRILEKLARALSLGDD